MACSEQGRELLKNRDTASDSVLERVPNSDFFLWFSSGLL